MGGVGRDQEVRSDLWQLAFGSRPPRRTPHGVPWHPAGVSHPGDIRAPAVLLSVRCVTLVPMSDLPPMRDLADRLFAAAANADAHHHDLCAHPTGGECSCGTPRLLMDLAATVKRLGLAPQSPAA